MNEFIYKFKCACNDKLHSLAPGAQKSNEPKSKLKIEKVECFECNTKIKLIKTVQILKDDKIINTEA